MNEQQMEEILSKLVPLTLELSAQLIQLMDHKKHESSNARERRTVSNAENIRSMCDELLDAFRDEEDVGHRLVS